ncbi:MAG: hypothetical protein JW842_11655 [Prolixibacteraceae bacterium]|nr:hypothetical protein [Prolixibacteraceae bacterium]
MSFSIGGYAISPGFIDSITFELGKGNLSEEELVQVLLELSFENQNEPTRAIDYGKSVIKITQKNGMQKQLAYAHGYVGLAELRLGNHLQSIEHFIESAYLFRELEMYTEEGYALGSIGTAFQHQGDLSNSIKYYQQCLHLFEQANDTFFVANSLLNIGEAYRVFDVADSAEFYYGKSMGHFSQLAENPQIVRRKALLNGNLGLLHAEKGMLIQAEKELEAALLFFEQDSTMLATFMSNLGWVYYLQGDASKGIEYMSKACGIALAEGLKDQTLEISLKLSEAYEKINDYQNSLQYYKRYKLYNDSIKDISSIREMEKMQSRFELAKKDEQIVVLNKLNKLQRMLAYFLTAGVMIFLILTFQLRKSNKRVKETNNRLNYQKELLEKSEKEKSLLLKELNHRVKNNLQMVSSLLNLQARQLNGYPAAEALIACRYRVEALTLIHQKLYREDVDTKIDLKEYLNDLTQNLVSNYGRNFQLHFDLESVLMKIDKAIPVGLIVNELITNALKYADGVQIFPELNVSLKKNEHVATLIIQDNGKGLADDFDFAKTSSFGIKLVNSLVKQLNGYIEWDNKGGTTWIVSFDISQ